MPAQQSFLNPADNMWYGVNAQGQVEKLLGVQLPSADGLGELTYVLESELTPEMKASALSVQQVPGGVNDDNWFDKAMDVVIPGGLAVMGGVAGAGAAGLGPAAAGAGAGLAEGAAVYGGLDAGAIAGSDLGLGSAAAGGTAAAGIAEGAGVYGGLDGAAITGELGGSAAAGAAG